jgi:anti-anti-sigma factor
VTDGLVRLDIEVLEDAVIAHVSGELDLAGAPDVGEQLEKAVPTSARGLVVDMGHLEFIDSSGVAMLFGLARRLANRRQELRVVARDGEAVARVLQIVELERAAPVHGDLPSALSEIAS